MGKNIDSSRHGEMAKNSMNWDGFQAEGEALAGAILWAFERVGGNVN